MKHSIGNIQLGHLFAVAIMLVGCGGGAPDGTSEEEIGTSAEALIGGTWVAPPGNGVMTGYTGGRGPLTVCRANYDGGQQPGKVWQGNCRFGWGNAAHVTSSYTVLLNGGYTWITLPFGDPNLPSNAIDGGDAGHAAGDVRLGVCQAFAPEDSTWHPGKFYAQKCNIEWADTERVFDPNHSNVRVLVK